MSKHRLHYQSVQQLMAQHIDFVAVVVTDMQGSAPQEPGAKMLVTKDSDNSPYQGTIGGGKLELFAINHAKQMLLTKSANHSAQSTENMTLNLQSDIGMSCGGVVQLFFEVCHHNHWHIAVFGAGHVAQALIPLLLTLDCQVYCIDNRVEWLGQLPDHPALNKISHNNMPEILAQLPSESFVVSVTRGHGEDVKIIAQIANNRIPPFIGIIGSDSKAVILKKDLLRLDVNPSIVEQIHCPVGLPFGKDTPAEIAVSICAQLLQIRDKLDLSKG